MAKGESYYDYTAKLVIIGDSGVGKTNILTRFCHDLFQESHVATIGVDFNVKTIQVKDKKLKLQIWDTAGQERFRTITEAYYKGAAGIIFVYSVDCRQSFESIGKWIQQVSQRASPGVKMILVANKIDIVEDSEWAVTNQEGQEMASECGLQYIEVSAKQDKQIQELFYRLGSAINDRIETQKQDKSNKLEMTVTLRA